PLAHRTLHSFPTRRSSDLDGDSAIPANSDGNDAIIADNGEVILLDSSVTAFAAGAYLTDRISSIRSLDSIASRGGADMVTGGEGDRKSTRLNSSHVAISYA